MVVVDGRVLLVPHIYEDAPTLWYPPGGRVEFGERLEDAARREFQEETGLLVELGPLVTFAESLAPGRGSHSVSAVFRGSILGGEIRPEVTRHGVKTAQWFDLRRLPDIAPYMRPAVRLVAEHGGATD